MARSASRVLPFILVLGILFVILVPTQTIVSAQSPPKINWVSGPANVDLGDVAELKLGAAYIFANGEDTRKIWEYAGEPTSGLEVGCVLPKAESEEWSIIFEYDAVGYVKDDEKDTLDSQAILESIRESTEEANKKRAEIGAPAVNVTGWYEEPHYDANSHNLIWAPRGEEEKTQIQIVNYNTRLLGRYGCMAVRLIADPATLSSVKPKLDGILANFSWKAGKSYAEWVAGDKVAEIGLTALAAGGAAAIAAKTGLLGKIWKFLVAGVAALIGAISALIKRLRGQKRVSTA